MRSILGYAPILPPDTVFTIESPGAPDIPGQTKPRRAAYLADKPLTGPPRRTPTIWEVFDRTARLYGSRPYLGHRPIVGGVALPYVWQSYSDVRLRVTHVASGLVAKGLAPAAMVGIYSINCPEWLIAVFGLYHQNMTCVPLYDTLGDEAVVHIINQTEMKLAFVSASKIKNILKLHTQLPTLKTIVALSDISDDLINEAKAANLDIITLSDLENLAAENVAKEVIPDPESIATICYTSGTTGCPKGAMLTHGMTMSCVNAVTTAMNNGRFVKFDNGGTHFSYLPLAHVFENAVQWFVVQHGGRVGFYQGDPLKILEDLQELKPSCFVSVPRLLNRIYDRVWSGIRAKGGLTESLFKMAYESKKSALKNGYNTNILWDNLIFRKVQAALGGRVKFILSGSAPLSSEVMEFLRVTFAVEVFEGYGQTEVCAAATITWVGDYETGHVGVPVPSCEIKLIDVPSMNYLTTDKPNPRGEICIRGNNTFKGYYKEPEKSKEAVDEDGWVHTGDVGMFDSRGRLAIIDRVKNIFKLSQGEYVAPEKVENTYQQHTLVSQAFVYGHSLESCTVGIIVPDEPELVKWTISQKLAPEGTDLRALVENPEVIKAVLKNLQGYGRSAGLKGFENIRALHMDLEPFSVENNLLTPTFKLRRADARAKYQDIIDGLYRSIAAE